MIRAGLPVGLPAQPHLPGRTARPDEAVFADLRASVQAGMTPEALAECAAWQGGLALLEQGYFWEAHELFEPVWMALPPNSAERTMARAMIQIANAFLKARMGWPRAAGRLRGLAAGLLAEVGLAGRPVVMGLRLDRAEAMLSAVVVE